MENKINIAELFKDYLQPSYIKQTLRDKLKDCDKDMLVDLIADVCTMYIKATMFSTISNANYMQQCIDNVQTNTQELDNLFSQKVNINLYGKN